MQRLRIGVVGLGNMGGFHCKTERREQVLAGTNAEGFDDYQKLIES